MTTFKIVGSFLSPYVRKVLVTLNLKGLSYEVDPIVPFYGNDQFTKHSPLRLVPVLFDHSQDLEIWDSTAICEYLDEQYPEVQLYPSNLACKSKVRCMEEYADSRLGDVFIWRLFNQNIRKHVWGDELDVSVINHAKNTMLPEIMDYLESMVPEEGNLFGELTIADVAIGSFFRNLEFVQMEFGLQRWKKTSDYIARLHGLEAFRRLEPFEQLSLRTPITEVRDALLKVSAPISADTFGTAVPSVGPMTRTNDE